VDDENGPKGPEELERQIEQLEEQIEQTTNPGPTTKRRLGRMRRQITEARPDALFSTSGEVGLRGIARRTDSYGFVLIMLAVLIWVFVPFASTERWATLPTIAVFFLTVLISMHTSFVRGRWLVLVLVLDSGLLLLGIIGYASDNDDLRVISNGGFGLLLLATAFVILRRVLQHQTITSRTLSGAVSAFLLVGLAFASIAEAIVLHDPTAYITNNGDTSFAAMLYFSFVTQATLGYGDIVPVNNVARSLATMQAIAGQIYLVTIVARLVSLLGVRRFGGASDPPAEPSPQSQ
jgi:hypothetical protein